MSGNYSSLFIPGCLSHKGIRLVADDFVHFCLQLCSVGAGKSSDRNVSQDIVAFQTRVIMVSKWIGRWNGYRTRAIADENQIGQFGVGIVIDFGYIFYYFG